MNCAKTVPGVLAAAWLACGASSLMADDMKPAAGSQTAQAEIQVSLCSPPEQIVRALDLRSRAKATEVWLFDDGALALFGRGLRFRLRMAKNDADLTVKVANQDCTKFAAQHVPPSEGKCEVDVHGATVAGAVSLSGNLGARAARNLISGRLPLSEALTPTQIRYLREVLAVWPLPGDIRAFGPQRVTRYRGKDPPYDVDVSTLPGGESYIEISRKVAIVDADRQRERLLADMARASVAVCTDQSAQAINKLRALQRPR